MSDASNPVRDSPAPPARSPLRWLPAASWSIVIFALSSVPGSNLPGHWSYEAHFTEYAILGLLVTFALARRPGLAAAMAIALAVCSAYGITDELHQAFVPGRTPDPLDWGMDTLGAAAGAASMGAAVAWRRAKVRRRSPGTPAT